MSKKTIYLNTGINCNKITEGTGDTAKTFLYSFDIPPIEIKNNSKLRVVSFIHYHNSGTKLVAVFKIKDIQFNNNNYWGNDGYYPTIIAFDTDKPSYYNGSELLLGKQTINMINIIGSEIILTDTIPFSLNSGINSKFIFCITLEIEE